uniref:Uncharacterized protein n=1 Tax=Mustela putorius furo TaxID=9669 RepID=M3Z3G4_MUSPF
MASPCSRGDSPCGGLENAPAEPPALFPLVFLSGEVKGKKASVQSAERGPSISCRSHGSGESEGREGRKSRSHFVLLTRAVRALSPPPAAPSPKKGIRKFSLGRNRGRCLRSCAHREQGLRGRAATAGRGGGEVRVPPSQGASFVLRPRLRSPRAPGCPGCAARGGRAASGLVAEDLQRQNHQKRRFGSLYLIKRCLLKAEGGGNE